MTRAPLLRGRVLPWLLLSLFLGVGTQAKVPTTGLDPSWVTALNTYGDLRFGPELIFTYGPWGFLDVPLIVSRPFFLLALLAAVAATGALWLVTYSALTRVCSTSVAAAASSVVVVIAGTAETSSIALCAAAGAVLLRLLPVDGSSARPRGWGAALYPAGLSVVAALAVQIKVSDGVVIAALAVGLAVVATSVAAALVQVAGTLAAMVVATVVLWLVRGQSAGDLSTWLAGSFQLVRGYGEALSIEVAPIVPGYLGLLGVVVLAVASTVPALRGRSRDVQVVVAATMLMVLTFAFKDGFTRHDRFHEPGFFLITGGVLVVLVGVSRRPAPALIGACLALVLATPALAIFDPVSAVNRWRYTTEVLLNPTFGSSQLDRARAEAQSIYALPESIRSDLETGVPVTIDPWEVTVAWAYDLNWAPIPVFQTYAAVTDDLDRRNAEAITNAPDHQRVLRRDEAPIDGHRGIWDSPRYQLAIACNYGITAREGLWVLLRHRAPRCEAAEELTTQRVAADETVTVPEAGDDEIVLASFTPDRAGLAARLGALALKNFRHLLVSADGETYRVSRMSTTGPLLVSFPAVEDGAFDAFSIAELAFSKPGEISFSSVRVAD